jgi:hypothetical protein
VLAGILERRAHAGHGVPGLESEALVDRVGETDGSPRGAGQPGVEPHLLDEGRVLDQAQGSRYRTRTTTRFDALGAQAGLPVVTARTFMRGLRVSQRYRNVARP